MTRVTEIFSPLAANERQPRVDWLMLVAIGGLMVIGVFFVYSATMVNEAAAAAPWYDQAWFRQVVWYGLGIVAMAGVCAVDYRVLSRWSLVAYVVTLLMLLAVLIPGLGAERFGARRWIDLGPFSLQPSEFAKLGFILAMANFLSRPVDELRSVPIFWKALGMVALPFLLIMKEPDLGSALVFIPVLGMFAVPDILGGTGDILIGNLIKDQFLGTRDWPFGSALSIMLTLAVLSVAGLATWFARSAIGQRA